jgi:D-alanine-D-alanine ligase
MSRRNIVVLMGGMSSEHEVSVASGTKVAETIDLDRYEVTSVLITKEGEWCFPDAPPMEIYEATAELKRRGFECAFIALHGAFGEDGRIQGMLDLLGIPYTSSGCAASGLAIDKLRSKAIVAEAGIRVAPYCTVTLREWQEDADGVTARTAAQLGFPCVVKSPCQGSSVGLAIARDEAAFRAAMPEVLAYGNTVMIEAFVRGTEVTCGVLDIEPSASPVALPVTEIRPIASSFFDYHAKYTPGASAEITPAEIADEVTSEVQKSAVKVHDLIGCSIWSRSDFIVGPDGPVWLEVNTVPGMTATSLYPQAAAAAGIPYAQLLSLFIEAAIAKFGAARKGQ